ncbi:MAG: mechanosensitive ion channel family protein [Candidatus Nitrosocaldus sp.]
MVEEIALGTIEILGTRIELLKVLISIAIVAAGVVVARLVRIPVSYFLTKYAPQAAPLASKAVFWIIVGVAVLSAIGNLGVELTGVLLAGGIAGIIIGFAVQSTVANLFSGLFMQIDRAFRIGDAIEVAEMNVAGVVTDITAFSVVLRRFDGVYVRIPNEKIFTSQVRNFGRNVARRVEVTVGIAYKEDMNKAIEVIRKIVDEDPRILALPEPKIMVWELGSSSVNINVWCWVPTQEFFNVRGELVKKIKEALDANGIEIPFQQVTVWFGDRGKGKVKEEEMDDKGGGLRLPSLNERG